MTCETNSKRLLSSLSFTTQLKLSCEQNSHRTTSYSVVQKMIILFVSFAVLTTFSLSSAQFGEFCLLQTLKQYANVSHSEGDDCTSSQNGEKGICRAFKSCQQAAELEKTGLKLETCAYSGGTRIVCCPSTAKRISEKSEFSISFAKVVNAMVEIFLFKNLECEEYQEKVTHKVAVGGLIASPLVHEISASFCDQSTGLIIAGTKTRNGEFPHMAAIAAKDINGKLIFFCGGSLISEKFVLTAAHCNLKM